MGDVGAPELIIILVVVLVLFGGAKLPELARSLGKAKNEFQKGVDEGMPNAADDHVTAANAPAAHDLVSPPAIGAPPISTTADEVTDVAPLPASSPEDRPHPPS